jgi:cysteinyl-tRNA synthetase
MILPLDPLVIPQPGFRSDFIGMDMDLKFPHHDNVMAQYKRLYDIPLWINNFFNIGHLTIEEIKMSNTLKKIVTIQEALANYPPQQIRLLFLLRSWSSTIEYSDD